MKTDLDGKNFAKNFQGVDKIENVECNFKDNFGRQSTAKDN
jgi:hypothetical protein